MPKHQRHSIRIEGYDYAAPGAYFITIVTHRRECLFGEIRDGKMKLSDYGKIVNECWRSIPDHFPNVELGIYVIMPNHVHGVIVIRDVGAQHAAPLRNIINVKSGSVGAIVRSFKSAVTKRVHELSSALALTVWQRNYYEQIIRNVREWNNIHLYIESNLVNWTEDEENPSHMISTKASPQPWT